MVRLAAVGCAALVASAMNLGATSTWWVDCRATGTSGAGTEENPCLTIQAAIGKAAAGDTIKVRPGDYDSGSTRDTLSDGGNLARVLITKPLRIESTDGAAMTHIVGASDTTSETASAAKDNGLGDNSVRCVTADDNAVGSILKGFTIRGGRSRYANNQNVFAAHGGGIASHKENALTVVDCVISNNVATRGGACHRVNLVRSLLTHNKATNNGGAATRVCYHYACILAHNGDADNSTSKSAISDPRSVIHCSLFGNGNGGLYLEADYAAKVYNSIVILEGNNNGTASSLNIGSGTSKAPTFTKCVYSLINNAATKVTVDTSDLIDGSVKPWQTMVSPYSGDYRAVKGGFCDGTANPTVVSPSWVPEEFRGMDFYGRPFLAGGKANIGAVAASAKVVGGVHVLNGSVTWSVDGYEKNLGYGEKMYVRGTPAESITLRETGENKIFNFEQHYRSDWGWYRVFDNVGKLVIAMPPEGTVVTNWSNGAKGVVYADPKGSDANDGSAAVADGNGKGPVKTLKKAVELAAENYIVRCAEGVYDEGTVKAGSWATRLALTRNVVVRGAGAGKSIIKGNCDLADPSEHGCGADAVRCVYADNVGKTSAVIGFTLQDGYISGGPSSASEPFKGGAFYAPVFNSRAQLVDCVVTNCAGSRGVMYGGWAHRTKFVGNHLSKNSSESFRDLIMSACVVVDNNPAKGGYYTVANGSLVVVNSTFAGNGNPDSSTIFGQLHAAVNALNCVVDGDKQNSVTNYAAGNWQSYRSGQTGWTHVTEMKLADLAARDLRPRADSPVVGGGSFGNDAVLTGLEQCNNLTTAEWYSMVTSTDIDGNPYLYVDGRPTAGAYQRPVAVVTVEAVAAGEVEPAGAWMKSAGETVTLTAKGAIERKFLGFWVNGELVPQGEKTYVFTVPDGIYSKPFVLKAAYNTDWYVNPDPAFGKDTNDGWTPQTAKRSLVAAMKGPVSGDTVHAAIGVYNDGTVADGDNSVTKCRVNVPSGVTLLGDDRDGTIIEGKASATVSSGLGADSVRGVYLCANAKLKNLTVRKGYTHNGGNATESRGAGVLGKSTDTCIVEDCTIRDCRGSRSGGGQYVTFNRCRLIDNYGASTGAAGRNCSYYNTYIVGCSGNARSMQETTWFVNSTYDVDENGAATVRNLFEGGNARIENSVFLQPNSILSSAVTSASNSVFVTGSGISLASAKCGNVRTNTLEEIALNAVTRVPTAASCLVDAGNTAMVERIGDLDCDCSQRVYNGAIDIGAFEHDWRAQYASDLGSAYVTVTAADPQVAEENGIVRIPSGEIAVGWRGAAGRSRTVTAQVTGTGDLAMYVGDAEEPEHVWTASDDPVPYKWRPDGDVALRFVYTPGLADGGAAYLTSFEDAKGMTILLR